MRISGSAPAVMAAIVVATSSIASTTAFQPASVPQNYVAKRAFKTSLYFLDTSKSSKGANANKISNPIQDIQSYIPAAEPVEVRPNLVKSTCLVACSTNASWNANEIFYLLNSEDSAFDFNKIAAVSTDVPKTKKSLLTRQARYTGLLNKLDYCDTPSLPHSELLSSASSYIAVVDSLQDLSSLTSIIGEVENAAVLFLKPVSVTADDMQKTLASLHIVNENLSLVVLDQDDLIESVEQQEEEQSKSLPLMFYTEEDDVPELQEIKKKSPSYLLSEALRLLSECLQLQSAAGKTLYLALIPNEALVAMAGSGVSSKSPSTQLFPKLIRGLREAGYERSQEIDYMLRLGTNDYREAIERFETANPTVKDGVVTTNAWWEDPEFQKMVKESSLRKEELIEANRSREERLMLQEAEADAPTQN